MTHRNSLYGFIEAFVAMIVMFVCAVGMAIAGIAMFCLAACIAYFPLIIAIVVALVIYNGCIA